MLRPLLFFLLVASEARAQSYDAEARALFNEGIAQLDSGNASAALDKFRAAYALSPNPKLLLNIGSTLRLLGRDVEAAQAYQRYLRTAEPEPVRRAEVDNALREIFARVGRLRINVDRTGAQVFVDGVAMGVSPLSDVVTVNTGAHRVEAVLPVLGGQVIEVAPLAPGEERLVAFRFEEAREGTSAPLPSPASEVVSEAKPQDDQPMALPLSLIVGGDAEIGHGGVAVKGGTRLEFLRYWDAFVGVLAAEETALRATLGATAFPDWTVAPWVSGGTTIFFLDSARAGVHGGLTVRYALMRRLSLHAETAIEHFPSMPSNYERTFLLIGAGVGVGLL